MLSSSLSLFSMPGSGVNATPRFGADDKANKKRVKITDKNNATTVGAEIVRDGGKVLETRRQGDKVVIEYEK
ncbi:MAG: hypothetical protein VKJ04_09120 [Vampirovibrionales bacterium]|nr:hypothetical protein [Vampirovibrionales bacterium]